MWSLYEGGSYFFEQAERAALIRGWLLFDVCYYSSKYRQYITSSEGCTLLYLNVLYNFYHTVCVKKNCSWSATMFNALVHDSAPLSRNATNVLWRHLKTRCHVRRLSPTVCAALCWPRRSAPSCKEQGLRHFLL